MMSFEFNVSLLNKSVNLLNKYINVIPQIMNDRKGCTLGFTVSVISSLTDKIIESYAIILL